MSRFARVAQSSLRDSRVEGPRLARNVRRARLAFSSDELLVPRKIQEDPAVLAHSFFIVDARSAAGSCSRYCSSTPPSTRTMKSLWWFFCLLVATQAGPTDFIDCADPCDGGDVNYEIVASIRTMEIMGYTYKGRTYSTSDSDTFMGPTMRVRPGQSLWIKLVNNMTEAIGPAPPTAVDYWNMLQSPGEKIKYQFYKRNVADPSLLQVDTPNIPSHFDSTNLHVHGLDVEVHMFDPVGTHDPEAPHIALDPGECYCYRFQIPEHHPWGQYWYHPHLHGATAIQMWSGMFGLLYIDGPLADELAAYGVLPANDFVIWDPAFRAVDEPTHNLEVDEFLMGQTTLSKIHPFLVNGVINPTFNITVGEVLWLRVLCATVENENTFIIYPEGKENEPWAEVALPFWVIGSDGVSYNQPKEKTILVLAGGMREEILLQFDEPGNYVISQQGIQGMQFFDMMGHPHDQIIATITVHPASPEDPPTLPSMPIPEMTFTPGYSPEEDIDPADVGKSETIVFTMGANRDQAPFPQYYVNGKAFDGDRLDFFAEPGEAREYILVNGNHNVHPFHIHVNRFQVQEMGSELSTTKYPVLEAVMDYDPKVWRDIVVVPPNGRARIWVQYKNYTGKTVFHCHFLAHEDTGMMSTLFIGSTRPRWTALLRMHSAWIFGVLCGAALVGLLMMMFAGKRSQAFDATEMNALKSKTVD